MLTSISKTFRLDPRSLALFRILMGFLLIADLFARIANLTEFYTDAGVLPRFALMGQFANSWIISPLNISGQPLIIFAYMLAALGSYIAFTIGFQTPLANFLSWLFFTSFTARNPVIAHGGDDLVRLCLFWSMFLNLSQVWAFQRNSTRPNTFLASFAFIAQLLLMYIWTGILKWHPIWHTEGSAVYYALNLETFVSPLGAWLLKMRPRFLQGITFATLALELVGPFAWILSVPLPRVRIFLAFLFIVFHLGLMLTLELGPFPFACAIYWTALLPSDYWDALAPKVKALTSTLVSTASFLSQPKKVQFNKFYWMREAFLLICFSIAFCWNIAVYSEKDSLKIAPLTHNVGYLLRLHQRWDMFAPFPKTADSWLVVDATLVNGSHYDTFQGRPVSFEKPINLSDDMGNTLWRKYLTNISSFEYRKHLPYFSRWLCQSWNQGQDQNTNSLLKAVHLKIWLLLEKTPPPGMPFEGTPPAKIWEQYCY